MCAIKALGKYTSLIIPPLVLLSGIGLASNSFVDLPNVTISGERISVQAMGVPLGELLEAIERETGIQFEVDEGILEEKIFVDLADTYPSRKALRRSFLP
jgi:hypothetical protein